MPKEKDPVELAKTISKLTKLPLPNVAQIMQKYPLTADGGKKAYEECVKLARAQLEAELKKAFNL